MTPLVLVPGMMCDGRLFGPQIAAFSGMRSLHLAPIASHDTITGLADAVLADAPPRFALVGLSMGGIVAMEIMARAPERVERLALLDANPFAETEAMRARRVPQIARVEAGDLRAVMRDEMKPRYLAESERRGDILDLCMAMALDLGPEVFVRQSRALAGRADQQATLARVGVPTLILCGEADILCPLERHQRMHELIPHSRLEVIPDAGHLPTLEQPEKTTAAVRRWLED